jgi:hypothetical protein
MKGNPKHLNSKFDYEYVKEHCDVTYWLPRWKGLLEGRYVWIPTGELESAEVGITDDTHRVESFTNQDEFGEEKTTYTQLEKVEDQYSTFKRLGFTEEEVRQAIAEGEAKLANQ